MSIFTRGRSLFRLKKQSPEFPQARSENYVTSSFYAEDFPPGPPSSISLPLVRGLRKKEKSFESDFGLIRILGNDLPPRHSQNQTLEALQHILKYEPELESVTKIFVLNRISSDSTRVAIIEEIKKSGLEYVEIPWNPEEYSCKPLNYCGVPSREFFNSRSVASEHPLVQLDLKAWVARQKIIYAMNNNGARNTALKIGQQRFRWTLPFDGQTMFTKQGWAQVLQATGVAGEARYLIFPMHRQSHIDEPQIGFRFDATEVFNEDLPYGRRSKVDLLMRLGVPGPHQDWSRLIWDPPFPELSEKEAGLFMVAGPVKRTSSGTNLEGNQLVARQEARFLGIFSHLRRLDKGIAKRHCDQRKLGFYGAEFPGIELDREDRLFLQDELSRSQAHLNEFGMPLVTDKTGLAPSRDARDYFSISPYWNSRKLAGIFPSTRFIDGQRSSDTEFFGREIGKTNRQSLYLLLNRVVLDWAVSTLDDRSRALEHSANWVRAWFTSEATSMNPHFEYAQVVPSRPKDLRRSRLIEARDLCFFLDACQAMRTRDLLDKGEWSVLVSWVENFYDWLTSSPSALRERNLPHNLATNYLLLSISLARFVGDFDGVVEAFERATSLLGEQLDDAGRQTHEISRRNSLHYSTFSLQLWCNFAVIASSSGMDLTATKYDGNRGLVPALRRHLQDVDAGWPFESVGSFNSNRIEVLRHFLHAFSRKSLSSPSTVQAMMGIGEPHSGIPPLWFSMQVFAPESKFLGPEVVIRP